MKIEGSIQTSHVNPVAVADALKVDNLRGTTTTITGGTVCTTFESEKLRSVIASVDDYLMNLKVAEEICWYVSR